MNDNNDLMELNNNEETQYYEDYSESNSNKKVALGILGGAVATGVVALIAKVAKSKKSKDKKKVKKKLMWVEVNEDEDEPIDVESKEVSEKETK